MPIELFGRRRKRDCLIANGDFIFCDNVLYIMIRLIGILTMYIFTIGEAAWSTGQQEPKERRDEEDRR